MTVYCNVCLRDTEQISLTHITGVPCVCTLCPLCECVNQCASHAIGGLDGLRKLLGI